MKVYLDIKNRRGEITGRKVVNAHLLKDRPHSVLVRLPDGNVVVRKKNRDVPHDD